jgi:hypothetical protein
VRGDLIDPDGENMAVRWFLAAYGATPGLTIGRMKQHLFRLGLPYWPDWADVPGSYNEHLNKAAAQAWLRYLFSLERQEYLTRC